MTEAEILADLRSIYGKVGVLTMQQLAEYLGRTPDALRKMRDRGCFPLPIKEIGGRLCVSILAVAQWLANHSSQSAEAQSAAQPETAKSKPLTPRRKAQSIGRLIAIMMRQKQGLHELIGSLEAEAIAAELAALKDGGSTASRSRKSDI